MSTEAEGDELHRRAAAHEAERPTRRSRSLSWSLVVTALRRYVLTVIAYADDGDDDDQAALALAEALLAPVAARRGPSGRKRRGEPRGETAPTCVGPASKKKNRADGGF